ncbi:transposase [Paenibacillus sp. 481]|uniref:transposase n=1 Tax=Paenibacillus sp. 481 TaxID=2835869 RepID=UPI003FA714AC|nr:transposase [Paenibacillus sp. 481]
MDTYICPAGKNVGFTYISRRGTHYYQIYTAKTKDCKACPLSDRCFTKSKPYRSITRPLFHEALEQNRTRSKTPEYKRIQRLRRIWCEGTFGTMKQVHNLRKTYKRGIRNALEHCLFSALAMNLKRMTKAMIYRGK